MAEIDLTGGPRTPYYRADATVGAATASLIKCPPFARLTVFASGALHVFNNGEGDGGTIEATHRLELTAAQAAAGYEVQMGGAIAGQSYAPLNIAAASGTVTVRASYELSDVRA